MKTNYALTLAIILSSGLLVQTVLSDDQLPPPAPANPPGATDPNNPEAAPQPVKTPAAARKKTAAKKAGPARKAPAAPTTATEPAQLAVPLNPGPALARQNNINIRGQAAIHSEVVARLKRGDRVTVLEEVTLKKPGVDEPAKWAKIALPSTTPVWVHSSFIDGNTKTVNTKKLNLRSGPGENYSVLGIIEKGATVKELDQKGDWLKIEAPANAFAFVAAHLLINEPAAPVVAAVEPPKEPVTPPVVAPPPPVAEPPPPPEVAVVTPPPDVAPAIEPVAPVMPAVEPPATTPAIPAVAPPVVAPPEVKEELVKRVITREGIVKSSASIQAPTYYVLESLDTHKSINYLHSTNQPLKDYWGQRIVVTGEEQLDERWPNIPVIYVESLQAVP